MRRWRVGTLSLGILLIVLGIVLLVARFRQAAILSALLAWWPLLLVLIGGEILVYLYTAKEPEPTIKYDFFSIFFIAVMIFCSIGLYGLTATGMLDKICRAAASSNMAVDVPPYKTAADGGIKNIVVSAPRGSLEIKRSSTLEVTSFGQAVVTAADREEAAALLAQNRVVMQREGDTLFVRYPAAAYPGSFAPHIREISHTLLLPAHTAVEITSCGNYIDLDLDSRAVGQNWLIKGSGRIDITVDAAADLTIIAHVGNLHQLGGSADWQTEERKNTRAGQDISYQGTVHWGTGKNILTVMLEHGEINVNEL
ncbi:MAG TPA: hypothetical protein GX699_10065 [Firmicutes bacterium]|nr:hypothetical protein [Bacillota bacterium]